MPSHSAADTEIKDQMPGEIDVDLSLPHSYFEHYALEPELRESMKELLKQKGFTQFECDNAFLRKQSTLYNTHTQELIEGYADEAQE